MRSAEKNSTDMFGILTFMQALVESIISRFWNWLASGKRSPRSVGAALGFLLRDGAATKHRVALSLSKRSQHLAIFGRTGTGKSSLLRSMAQQDIKDGRGFVFFDFHGDATPQLLAAIAAEEGKTSEDLARRTILVEPADRSYSVGLNPLELKPDLNTFVQVAELSQIIKDRCGINSFGPQTDELLRNSLHVLADNGLTLIELAALLTDSGFRASLMQRVSNPEVRSYFEERFDQHSEAMRRSMTGPVLNKVTGFTSDPHFRHILGQAHSTFSLAEAMDSASWVILCLPKGRLGEYTPLLASLLLSKIKSAAFARRNRQLFSLYVDEIQTLVSRDSSLEVLFSELRKFGIGMVTANQYLDQFPAEVRSAVLAIGTHIAFQLSSGDAEQVASAMDGAKPLAELLRNLPQRQFVIKSGSERWKHAVVPTVARVSANPKFLYERSREYWARRRSEIETEIAARRRKRTQPVPVEVTDGW